MAKKKPDLGGQKTWPRRNGYQVLARLPVSVKVIGLFHQRGHLVAVCDNGDAYVMDDHLSHDDAARVRFFGQTLPRVLQDRWPVLCETPYQRFSIKEAMDG
jgi:hypothetical protein